jgi:hypothetical protein
MAGLEVKTISYLELVLYRMHQGLSLPAYCFEIHCECWLCTLSAKTTIKVVLHIEHCL